VHQEDHPDGDPGEQQGEGTRLVDHATSKDSFEFEQPSYR
jgi:hypothetical protein